jgi:hypothetical protein
LQEKVEKAAQAVISNPITIVIKWFISAFSLVSS